MRIANNFPALSAFTSLNRTNKSLQKSIKTLSTGLRLNSASDDAAGFAIAEKMRSQLSGLDMAIRNSQDGVSLLQTAEGALGETNSMLLRMRELSLQACNDSLTSQDRQYLQLEIDELKKQIDKIAGTTQFNRKRILDGSSGALWSSSDLNVKAKINGGLTYVDQFGQKISSEGNYRIEVKPKPGQPQVQKSNIFNLDYVEETTRIEYVPIATDDVPEVIDDDVIDQIAERIEIEQLTEGDKGKGWHFDGQHLIIEESGVYSIEGTNQTLTDRDIKVSGTSRATIFLSDIHIDKSNGGCAFKLEAGASVEMYLSGNNYFRSGKNHSGLEAPKGTTMSISSISGDGSINGTIEAYGGDYGAGIGGEFGSWNVLSSGEITILGGTVKAYGGEQGAGIGGAWTGGGQVTVIGGYIEAYGGFKGAGIGSGHQAGNNRDTIIKIAGGIIKAYGGTDGNTYNAAGIGGACHSDSGTILIKEGLVQWLDKAKGKVDPDSFPVLAQRGSPNIIHTAQDIGHGTNSSGGFDSLIEVEDIDGISVTPSISPASKRIPVVIADVSVRPSTIKDIMKFHNSEGVFLVDTPKTITITQGNGKTADVTLYSSDSIYDVAEKINNAISEGLGQNAYTDNSSKFCTIANGPEGTSESVCVKEDVYRTRYQRNDNGNLILDENNNPIPLGTEYSGKRLTYSTMLVRSAVPGRAGELYFSGDEDLLNALGLNTIQESTETTSTATVYDAHSGQRINEVKAEGSEFKSIIPPEIDIEVDPMAGLVTSWDDNTRKFIFAGRDSYSAVIHLKDNGITFQTGANRGEDFMIQLGDTSCDSLGISGINVLTRESASRALSTIDRAINKISSQRAKIGAYQNALEDTMTNLTTTSANVTSAVSRISDADMAHETMNLVKLQILNQSGTSMLSQANQLPRSVMNLMQ